MKASNGVSETDKNSCVIDIKWSNHKKFYENSKGERICRICHLTNVTTVGTANSATSTNLIQLGCACKDELGIAHVHCVEAWFKLKRSRLIDIHMMPSSSNLAIGKLLPSIVQVNILKVCTLKLPSKEITNLTRDRQIVSWMHSLEFGVLDVLMEIYAQREHALHLVAIDLICKIK
ncbi:hypothetical protein VNO78_00861 [Psophocarpus tetragonolobus]|uniref:RING-CH-type domain-containing protein n=1 Tax=Psophocarpus tetragonolobus TaxID=3891 RepID=A0AAN9XV90_PSOTE